VLEGLAQRIAAGAEHLLVEVDRERRMVQPETRAHQRSAWSGPASRLINTERVGGLALVTRASWCVLGA
jgi:hypothetical protein